MQPLGAKIFSDCGRIKAGIPLNLRKLFCMMTAEILKLVFQKRLNPLDFFNYVENQSVSLKIKDVKNSENPNLAAKPV